jgi:hypothetical protein
MTESTGSESLLVESLRGHVVDPIAEAESIVRREHKEVEAERRAFQRFEGRVTGIETVSPRSAGPERRILAHDTEPRPAERLREAYRNTVMSVPHYEEMYGESLVENFTAELSAEVAAILRRNGTSFTDVTKIRLTAVVGEAVAQRERFCATLENELDSLAKARSQLTDRIDQLDETPPSSRNADEVENSLSNLARRRQVTLRTYTRAGRMDGHDLCPYLYDDPEWTYPVLTAITRLRDALPCRTNDVSPVSERTGDLREIALTVLRT